MTNRLYVGNLPYTATTDEVKMAFGKSGTVTDAKVLTDRETGRSRGFGFVTMATEEEAKQAINDFNGFLMGGRALVVNEAQERQSNGGGPRNYAPRAPVASAPPEDNGGGQRRSRSKGSRRRRDDDWDDRS